MRPALILVIVACVVVAGALLYRQSHGDAATPAVTTPSPSPSSSHPDVAAVSEAMAKAKAAHLTGAKPPPSAGTPDDTAPADDVSNPAAIAVADAGRLVHTPAVEAAAIASQLNEQAINKAKNKATKKLGQLAPAGLSDDQFAQLRKLVEAEAVELASGNADVVAVQRETDKNATAMLTDDKQRSAWTKMRASAD